MAKVKINRDTGKKPEGSKDVLVKEEPLTPLTREQDLIGQAVRWGVLDVVKNDKPYELSKAAKKAGIDPSLTCIGGACNLYKNLGVDFSSAGKESEGVRESDEGGKVVEYNPTFAKNYDKAGFTKIKNREINSDELSDLIKTGYLHAGDIVQYINEKGVPEHSNVVYDTVHSKKGGYTVYNAFKHSTVKNRDSKDPYVYTLDPNASVYKTKKFNVYRLSPEKAKELVKSDKDRGGRIYESNMSASIDDDVSKVIQDKILSKYQNSGSNMYRNELRNYFGVENWEQIPRQKLIDMAIKNIKSDKGDWADFNKVSKWQRKTGEIISKEDAMRISSEFTNYFKRLYSNPEFGTSVKDYQTRNLIKKFGEDYNKK